MAVDWVYSGLLGRNVGDILDGKSFAPLRKHVLRGAGRSGGSFCGNISDRVMRGIGVMLILWCCGVIWGQESRAERLKSLRIALITEALELTPEEAQAFWPVYNARDAALQRHREEIHQHYLRLRGTRSSLSAQAYADSVSALYFRLWEGEASIRKAYHERLLKVLPAEKVAKLYLTEIRMLRRVLGEGGPPHRDR